MNKCLIILSFFVSVCIDRTVLQNSLQCGVRQIRTRDLIVNGHDTVSGEWPWHAAIYHKKTRADVSYVCGGTIITESFVITAAHCIKGENGYKLLSRRIFIRLGVYNLDVLDRKKFQQHNIVKIYQPSNKQSQSLKNDIALLELDTIAEFDDFVQPACVSLTKELTGQVGTVVGWGVTEDDDLSTTLKSAQLPVIDSVECLESNRDFIGPTLDRGMFCAGYTNGTSVCNGDSGGGLFFNKSNVWYLGGIVSFAQAHSFHLNRCYTKGYTVFTKVYFYLEWISNITNLQFLNSTTIQTSRVDYDDTVSNRSEIAYENYANLLPQNCGVYNTNSIRYGHKAEVYEFPWMAMLLYKIDEYWNSYCGGSLVSKRYVLTSTQCSKTYSIVPVKVRLGELDNEQDPDCSEIDGERKCAPPMKEYGIKRFIQHPNYSRPENDIALIRLDEDVGFDDHIQPICLPVTQSLKDLSLSKYIVTGWGETETGVYSRSKQLHKATVSVANMSECRKHYKVVDNMICTGGTNSSGPCRGDYGGPLGFPARYIDGMRFVQFGIIFVRAFCRFHGFSLHTNLTSNMDWIMQTMKP